MNSETWKHIRHVLGENPVTLLAVTLLLGLWYGLHERKRFAGPAWAITTEQYREP